MNVVHVMYDHIGCNWSHRNSNISFKEGFGSHDKETFNRFTTHSKVSTAA